MSLNWFLMPTIFYSLFTFIRLNFLNLKSFKTNKDINTTTPLISMNHYNPLYYFYLLMFFILVCATHPHLTAQLSVSSIFGVNLIFVTVLLLGLLVLVVLISSYMQNSSLLLVNFLTLFTFLSLLLLTAQNALQFYIVLEILAYMNILFFILFKVNTQSNSNQWLIASLISFLLNFLSSIMFFMFIVMAAWRTNYPTWDTLLLFNVTTVDSMLVSLFILMKLGAGPWLVGNYHSYLGYNLYYLMVYTLNLLIIMTPILFILYIHLGAPVLILLFLTYLYVYISSTMSTVKSMKSLFAYSTVILYSYLLLIILF